MDYALMILLQFWLQSVPYADLNTDNCVDLKDYAIVCRIVQGDLWVAKYNWFCENTYADGRTSLVEGWTYTVWETPPVKLDRNPQIPGFTWVSPTKSRPVLRMNYIFFERMFPLLTIGDMTKPVYIPSQPGFFGVTVSGYVTNAASNAVEGVKVSADNGRTSCVTDSNGYYELLVPFGWSGTITAEKDGRNFSSTGNMYEELTGDMEGQNFISASLKVLHDANSGYATIQSAIDEAVAGDEVILGQDIYQGPGNCAIDFKAKPVTLRSGEPNNPSVVQSTVVYCDEGPGLIFHSGEDGNSVVEGITFEKPRTASWGRGIVCRNSSPVIRNCMIKNCDINLNGAAIVLRQSNAKIEGCVMTGNITGESGGAIAAFNSSPAVTNCLFAGNYAGYAGGAIAADNTNMTINNCTLSGNEAYLGGAVRLANNSLVRIENSICWGDTAEYGWEIAIGDVQQDTLDLSELAVHYSDINGGRIRIFKAPGYVLNWMKDNIRVDPCFVAPGFWDDSDSSDIWVDGDYHLRSQAGRYQPVIYAKADIVPDGKVNFLDFAAFASSWNSQSQSVLADFDHNGSVDFMDLGLLLDNYLMVRGSGVWVYDDVNSPCIDAGDPNSDWTGQLWPHGKCLNMGTYSATPQASMSPSDAGYIADFNNDGFVDTEDLAMLGGMWLAEDILLPENIDRTGPVNFRDFARFAENWPGEL